MTLFFLILLVISLVVFAFTHWRPKPKHRKPSIKPLLPSVISKNQLGLSKINIGKINFGPPQAIEVKPKEPLSIQPAPVNQPIEAIQPWQEQPKPSTPPTSLNEPAAPTSPVKPTQLEPPANLPI